MPEFVDGFIVVDVVEVHKWFATAREAAQGLVTRANRADNKPLAIRAQAVLDDIKRAWDVYNNDLRTISVAAAAEATKGMRDRLQARRQRPSGAEGKPFSDYVEALPLTPVGRFQSGAVGVGNVDLLKQAINPRGYGPYWRALEYGTGRGTVPSQIGRVIYGSFTRAWGADPTPPMARYRGGAGPHPIFVSGGTEPAPGAGRIAGMGTIAHEIEPKEFIKKGADEAAVKWRRNINLAQDRAIETLKAAMHRLGS